MKQFDIDSAIAEYICHKNESDYCASCCSDTKMTSEERADALILRS